MDVIRIREILEKRTSIDSSTGCWLYLGVNSDGYGQVTIDYVFHYVHVLSGKLFLGYENNPNFLICHKCPNKNCWNPEHLYIGTYSENNLDKVRSGDARGRFSGMTQCIRGHELSGENLYIKSDGYRGCKTCRSEASKRSKQKNKEMMAEKIRNMKIVS